MNGGAVGSVPWGVPLRLSLVRSPPAGSLGDEAGLRAAWAAHGAELHRLAARLLGDGALADDAVQETFLRAWRSADRFDAGLGSLRGWLFTILRNVVIDLSRARACRPPVGTAPAEVAVDDEAIEACLRSWLVEEALARLSADHREVIVRTYFAGVPAGEVAAALGVPVGTVRSRLFYGLKALRLTLDELGWDGG